MLTFNPNNFGLDFFSSFSLSLFWKRKVIDWVNTDVFNVLSQFAVYAKSTKYLWAKMSPEIVHYSCKWEAAADEREFYHSNDGVQWRVTFPGCFPVIFNILSAEKRFLSFMVKTQGLSPSSTPSYH